MVWKPTSVVPANAGGAAGGAPGAAGAGAGIVEKEGLVTTGLLTTVETDWTVAPPDADCVDNPCSLIQGSCAAAVDIPRNKLTTIAKANIMQLFFMFNSSSLFL